MILAVWYDISRHTCTRINEWMTMLGKLWCPYCIIWLDKSVDAFSASDINTSLTYTHTHTHLTKIRSPSYNFVQVHTVNSALLTFSAPGLGDLLSKWLPTCAVRAPRGRRAAGPWLPTEDVATGSKRLRRSPSVSAAGPGCPRLDKSMNRWFWKPPIMFEDVWLEDSGVAVSSC